MFPPIFIYFLQCIVLICFIRKFFKKGELKMEFPSELLATAQPLIGFHGLDLNNSSHKAVYDSFNRTER
jgi:hypothetical protein